MGEPSAALSLDAVLDAFGLAAHQAHVFDPAHEDFDAARGLIVLRAQFEAARPLVRRRYPPRRVARVILDGGVRETSIAALPVDAAAWLLPALAPEEDRRSLVALRRVMERLFGPDGCPWDREQTHESLRRYLLEEVYELVDAIDRDDTEGLREEVGDVLAHMFMQTTVAMKEGTFTLDDAVEYANEKFVRRHPHVFGDEETTSADAQTERWEQIKAAERAEKGSSDAFPEGALDSVPQAAPALQRARALARRARRAGLGDPPTALDEAAALALTAGETGAMLFAAAMLAAERDEDAEEALRETANAFARAFRTLEAEARAAGVTIDTLPMDRRAEVWAAVFSTARADR